MKKTLSMLALMSAILVSCTKPEIHEEKGYLNVYYEDIVFPSKGGEEYFDIESNTNWTISNSSDWLTIEPTKGNGNASITLTATASDVYDDRNTVITVKAEDKTETFTVTQKYAEALLVTKNKFDIPQEGGDFTIEIQSNISYEIQIDSDSQSWISEVPKSKALTTYTHTFSVANNPNTTKRNGSIEFIGSNGKAETVNIYQAQKDELVLSESEALVPAKGGEVRVQLRSNVDYEVIIPEDVDWVEQIQSDKADELVFNVKPNSETYTREVGIIVKDKNSDLSQPFKITQIAGNIIIEETDYEVPARGDTLNIIFTPDVEDYEIIIDEDYASWVSYEITKPEDSYQHILTLYIGPNTVNRTRTAKIDIKDINSAVKQTISVKQLTGDIILENSRINANVAGETVRVPFATDIEYEVNIPEEYSEWISLVSDIQTKALRDTSFCLKIEPNATENRREARIEVKDKYSDLSQTLTISQDYMRIGIDGKSYTVPARGQELTVRTTSANIEYKINVPEEFSSWISVLGNNDDINADSFTLKIEPNNDLKVRNATISISDKNDLMSEKISIQQEIAEMTLVNRDSSELNSFGTTLLIKVASNVETELIIPDDAQSWIQDATESRDLDADIKTFTLNISENESSDTNRETEVILKDKYSPMQLKYYILQYNNSEYHGNVLLDSQDDLKTYSKYKRIYGNVNIDYDGPLQMLDNQLNEVYGNVNIEDASSLDGLYGLEHIYGDLMVDCGLGCGTEGLNNLKTVQGNLTIISSVNIEYSAELNLESLTEIGGDCRAINCTIENLQSIGGSLIDGPVYLPNLKVIEKDLIIENIENYYNGKPAAEYFANMDFNKLERINGDLICPLTTCPFQSLESIGGNVDVTTTSTEGFSNLKTIGGNFDISDVKSFSGLTQLQSIGGDFNVHVSGKNEALFKGLYNLALINGVFTITVGYYGDFSSFDGLNNLTQVGGLCINVTSTSEALTKLTSFKGMESLEKISGDLIINSVGIPSYQNSFKAFTSFDGLNNLKEISGNIELTYIPNLNDVSALGNISNAVKDISITKCESLYDFSPLVPVVQNMTGIWTVYGCGYNPTKYQMLNGESKPQE